MKCYVYPHKNVLMLFLLVREDFDPADIPDSTRKEFDLDKKWNEFDTNDVSPISLDPDEGIKELNSKGWYVNRSAFSTDERVVKGKFPF